MWQTLIVDIETWNHVMKVNPLLCKNIHHSHPTNPMPGEIDFRSTNILLSISLNISVIGSETGVKLFLSMSRLF